MSPANVKTIYAKELRSFFTWAVAEKIVAENPVDPKRLPRLKTEQVLAAM